MEYTFTLENDPDDPEFKSIFIDNGHGCSAEIAGKIGSEKLGLFVLSVLKAAPQDQIRTIFNLSQ